MFIVTQEMIDQVKVNTRQGDFPTFTDDEIRAMLEETKSVVGASYRICLLQGMDDSVTLGPIKLATNKDFWLRMAEYYRQLWEEEKSAANGGEGGTFSFQRADEQW